jgi:hypothetical protein
VEAKSLDHRNWTPSIGVAKSFIAATLEIRKKHSLQTLERQSLISTLRNDVKIRGDGNPVVVLGE